MAVVLSVSLGEVAGTAFISCSAWHHGGCTRIQVRD